MRGGKSGNPRSRYSPLIRPGLGSNETIYNEYRKYKNSLRTSRASANHTTHRQQAHHKRRQQELTLLQAAQYNSLVANLEASRRAELNLVAQVQTLQRQLEAAERAVSNKNGRSWKSKYFLLEGQMENLLREKQQRNAVEIRKNAARNLKEHLHQL